MKDILAQTSSSASRRAFYAGKKLLAIALFNFEGTAKYIEKAKGHNP